MSQQIRVLQCSDCKLFQVDIVKKSKKWQCKVCNVKQFAGKEYLRGSGQQCRLKVQQLTMERAKKQQLDENNALELLKECEELPIQVQVTNEDDLIEEPTKFTPKKPNKWAIFAETSKASNTEEDVIDNDAHLSLTKSMDKKITNHCSTKNLVRNPPASIGSKREHSSITAHIAPKPKKRCSKWQNYI